MATEKTDNRFEAGRMLAEQIAEEADVAETLHRSEAQTSWGAWVDDDFKSVAKLMMHKLALGSLGHPLSSTMVVG